MTFTNLRYSFSQIQSQDLNCNSNNSSKENITDSDSSFSVSCLIVPRMMFSTIVGSLLHQLKSHSNWDLSLRSIVSQKMFWALAFMFLIANILSWIHANSSKQSTNPNVYRELNFLSYAQLSKNLLSWLLMSGIFQKLLAYDNESAASDLTVSGFNEYRKWNFLPVLWHSTSSQLVGNGCESKNSSIVIALYFCNVIAHSGL